MNKPVSIVVVALVMVVSLSCASVEPAADVNDGNPLVLLGAGVVARAVKDDPHATAQDKQKARDAYYDVVLRYAKATGIKREPARKFATAFADNTPIPEITCVDYSAPPPECSPAASK